MSKLPKGRIIDPSIVTELDCAYMAGIIDGEGSIGVYSWANPNGNRSWKLKLNITSTSLEWLEALQIKWGSLGAIRVKKQNLSKWKPAGSWTTMGVGAQSILRLVAPYMQIKRKQALLALEFEVGEARKTTSDEKKLRQAEAARIIKPLNRRGPMISGDPVEEAQVTIH